MMWIRMLWKLLLGHFFIFGIDKGGSSPAPPPVPDPRIQIAASRYDQRSPFGTQRWIPPAVPGAPAMPAATTSAPGGPGGRWVEYGGGEGALPQWEPDAPSADGGGAARGGQYDAPWTLETDLSPAERAKYDSYNSIAMSMLGRAQSGLNNLPSDPFSFDPAGGGARSALDRMSGGQPSMRTAYGDFNPNVRDMGTFNPNVQDLGKFAPNVNGDAVRKAVYDKSRLNLDPTYDRMQEQLDQRLVNQGLPIGSEAYGDANGVFGRERADAYTRASLDSIIQGANEEQNQFGRAISTRQQQTGEVQDDFGRQLATRGQMSAEQQADYARQISTRQQQGTEFGDDYQRFMQGNQAAFGNEMSFEEQQRQRQLQERQQRFNELAQLLGLTQMQAPPGGGGTDPNVANAFNNEQNALTRQYQGQMEGYKADVGQANAGLSAAATMAAAFF